ncbi:MAG: helix-turn-helix domain-containing protein [Acidimicrobiia bacterium]|jgi:AcrR family transcriptional regulator
MTATRVDRAALVRRGLIEVVAEEGLQGASMSLVARRAGVATGTAYVHYDSKEELLLAAFAEVKGALGNAALSGVTEEMLPRETFEKVWRNCYDFLRNDPATAVFLLQVEASPLRSLAHGSLPGDDPLTGAADRLSEHLVDLPGELLYELGLAPAVRLAATHQDLTDEQLATMIRSCWNAVRAM